MKIAEDLSTIRQERQSLIGSVGFVPTMGSLHRGHQELMEQAAAVADHVVVSIFINPTQFGPGEDYGKYPRSRDADLQLCRAAGVELLWLPEIADLYPEGHQTQVQVEPLGSSFEGSSRPGHFAGVATVVTKLFNAVCPDFAFFGTKDLQQVVLIERMTSDLLSPVKIVRVPTVRDSNGLALSSRNQYLTEQQKGQAGFVFAALLALREAHDSGLKQSCGLESFFRSELTALSESVVERFDIFDFTLTRRFEEGESVGNGVCSVAVNYCGVRLIDNIELCS